MFNKVYCNKTGIIGQPNMWRKSNSYFLLYCIMVLTN